MIEPVKLSEWARANGVSHQSATRWFHAGVLPVPARQLATGPILVDEPSAAPAGVAIYARVSSADQRGPGPPGGEAHRRGHGAEIARDQGRGRGGFRAQRHRTKLLSLLRDPGVGVIVVEHRDRLARFDVEYIEATLAAQGRPVVVVEAAEVALAATYAKVATARADGRTSSPPA
ncbi:MAG: IS607 family transposase [Acidimicrobiales bacterium]